MQIEHITLGGNSILRGSSAILHQTIEILNDFKIGIGQSKDCSFSYIKAMKKKKSTHGGHRENSGRKPGKKAFKNTEPRPTEVMRIPKPLVGFVKEMIENYYESVNASPVKSTIEQ